MHFVINGSILDFHLCRFIAKFVELKLSEYNLNFLSVTIGLAVLRKCCVPTTPLYVTLTGVVNKFYFNEEKNRTFRPSISSASDDCRSSFIMNSSTSFKTNFSTVSSTSITPLPTGLAIFAVSFLAISILAGTFGNARVCILLRRRQNLRKVPHYLLGNLALTGLSSALFSMPLLIVITIISYRQIYDLPVVEIFCKAFVPYSFFSIVLNAMTVSLMALDRQECVFRPFNRRLTTRNVRKIIAVT